MEGSLQLLLWYSNLKITSVFRSRKWRKRRGRRVEQLCLPMDLFHVEKEHECYKKRVESDGKGKMAIIWRLLTRHASRVDMINQLFKVLGQMSFFPMVMTIYNVIWTPSIGNFRFSRIFHVTLSSSFLYHAIENTANQNTVEYSTVLHPTFPSCSTRISHWLC